MKIRDDIQLGQHSHVGMARTENQDFFGYWEPDDDREFDLKGRIVVVCDGMGGHAGGEIASRLAVQTVLAEYQKDASNNIEEALRHSIEAANAAIQAEAAKEPKLQGMGSTCTALVHRRDMVYFGQVGDSRGYLIRGGRIKQMTKDHSLVQELVDQGLIDKSEMESHPDKNVILRSLGVKPQVDVDVSYVPANAGDTFLICSDGLSGPVSEQEMLGIVQASDDLRGASERLIELANRYGGFDNITVQLLKVVKTDSATTDKTDAKTITANFTQDQVTQSIAKARAEAVAKGKPVPPPKAAKEKSEVPKTEASRPAASAGGGGGGGGGRGGLVPGLVLGLVIGAGGMAGAAASGKLPLGKGSGGDAQQALAAARSLAEDARKKASSSSSPLLKRAVEEFEKAQAESDPVLARIRYATAAALFEVAGK